VTSFLFVFSGVLQYTPGRTFTQNTSNDVVPGKEVPFGGANDYILYLDPEISEKPSFRGPILTLGPKTALTRGCSIINYP